jgi:transposase
VRGLDAGVASVIRIDALWLAVQPMDMRAGTERLLASVVQVFGQAQAHHGYLFANARATRIKLLVHDGFGVWCAARRLNAGRFAWPRAAGADGLAADLATSAPMTLTQQQFDALVLGLPWQRLTQMQVISHM